MIKKMIKAVIILVTLLFTVPSNTHYYEVVETFDDFMIVDVDGEEEILEFVCMTEEEMNARIVEYVDGHYSRVVR